jgi:glycosyltransferase involved in cell wall biosynthesis
MSFVTVVVPAFNVEKYIEACIESVLNQTFKNFEILVVNDGSTDNTVERLKRFDDPRIHVIKQFNRGLAGARNTGIRRAAGDYVAFLDSDDRWHPEKLQRHVEHLDANPLVGVSYSQSAFIDEDGHSLGYFQKPKTKGVTSRDVFLRNPVGNGSAPVIRLKTLVDICYFQKDGISSEVAFFDESFRQSEDIECWLRIALTTAWRFEGIAEVLTEYRVNETGLSASLDRQLASWERVVAKAATYDKAFVAKHLPAARAFQYRYLARRAVRSNNPKVAFSYLSKALRSYPGLLIDEPGRTLATLAATGVRGMMPAWGYAWIEQSAMKIASNFNRH